MAEVPYHIEIGNIKLGNDLPVSFIAGPCQMESHNHAIDMAGAIAGVSKSLGVNVIYKTSFDKANRTSLTSPRGLGFEKAAPVFAEIKQSIGLSTLTDVHLPEQCGPISQVVDVLQIPAYLCRQTDLLLAAAITKKPINIKKGQFLAPWDMVNVAGKITSTGNKNVMLCERGSSFGYNTLITDMRSLPILAQTGYPVVFDATHSVQIPGGLGGTSGWQRQFTPVLARAAVSIGVAAVFMEVHQDPDNAPSDGPNMLPLSDFKDVVEMLMEFDYLSKSKPLVL